MYKKVFGFVKDRKSIAIEGETVCNKNDCYRNSGASVFRLRAKGLPATSQVAELIPQLSCNAASDGNALAMFTPAVAALLIATNKIYY